MKYRLFILGMLFNSIVWGQDIHFTQFTQSPIYLNPAMTGNFDGDLRLVGNFKNQWANIPVPFNTTLGSVDFNFAHNKLALGNIGAGIIFFDDNAGDSRLTTRSIQGTMAFNKIVGKKKKGVFSIGINIGYVYKGINTDKLKWDEQFNGDYFDPKIPITEQLNRMTIHSLDMGVGVNYIKSFKKNTFLNIGFSLQHLNSANQSFFLSSEEIKLQKKPMFNIATQFRIAKGFYLKPELFYQWQDKKQELVNSLLLKYFIKDKSDERIALTGGIYWRTGDSWIPTVRLDYNNLTVGVSYDVNTSELTNASSYNGGFELSAIYIIKTKKKRYPYNFCPFLWM